MLVHLAVNVYYWGDDFQRRLLVELLAPMVRELSGQGLLRRFWYTAFDARSPHLFILFSAPAERAEALRARLGTLLDLYLTAHPSTEPLSPEVIHTRHHQCRGKWLSDIDLEEGTAPNNSWRACEQPPDSFPLRLSANTANEDALWDTCHEWALWAVDQIAVGEGVAASIMWTAELSRALKRAGFDAGEYWRYYATTLLVGLDAALEHDMAASLAALPASIGEKNSVTFGRVWARIGDKAGVQTEFDRLVAYSQVAEAKTPKEKWELLRGINHCILSQLQQPVRLRIPLALYAWSRAVEEAGNAPA